MSVKYLNCGPSTVVNLLDQYRLTYKLTGYSWLPDSVLNAAGVETRLMSDLPKVGLVVRSLPGATTGDAVVVIRVQPTDALQGKTVAQLADAADFSAIDLTLGFDAFLGVNVDLDTVEFVGRVGSTGVTTGTSSVPGDSTAIATGNASAAQDDIWAKLGSFLKGAGVVILIGVGVYFYVTRRKG